MTKPREKNRKEQTTEIEERKVRNHRLCKRTRSPACINHRSNAECGIDEIPTVHMGVAAFQMQKKGIAIEKGELNQNIQKANRLIREIQAQVGKLKNG